MVDGEHSLSQHSLSQTDPHRKRRAETRHVKVDSDRNSHLKSLYQISDKLVKEDGKVRLQRKKGSKKNSKRTRPTVYEAMSNLVMSMAGQSNGKDRRERRGHSDSRVPFEVSNEMYERTKTLRVKVDKVEDELTEATGSTKDTSDERSNFSTVYTGISEMSGAVDDVVVKFGKMGTVKFGGSSLFSCTACNRYDSEEEDFMAEIDDTSLYSIE